MIFPHHVIGPAPATEKPLGHEGQPRQRVIQSARLGKEQPSGTHGARVAQPVTSPHATNPHASTASRTCSRQNVHGYTQRDNAAVSSLQHRRSTLDGAARSFSFPHRCWTRPAPPRG